MTDGYQGEPFDPHNDPYIFSTRMKLEERLRDAIGATGDSVYFVRTLSSDAVYDVEYAEGNGDVLRLLELAMSALSGAQAIAEKLHR